jgi:hypothetical protein
VTSAQIAIASTGPRDGFVIATMPAGDPYTSGARLVVGSVRRISADESPEKWRAWLWPSPGGVMHVTRSCEAADAAALDRLRDRLQKRGPWWAS